MTPSYCTQNNGDCLSCNLSGSDGVDCQGNDFFICLDDYLEEPDMILEPMDDDRDQEVNHD